MSPRKPPKTPLGIRRPGIPRPGVSRPRPRPPVRVPTPRLPEVEVVVPTKVAQAEDLIADIRERKARIQDDFYEIGVALSTLSARRYYQALGYSSFDDLLRARRLVGRMQALKLMAVAQAYPKKLALDLGVEKGYALIRYTAETPALDVARDLATSNVTIAGQRVREMSATDLREATKRVKAGPPPRDEDAKAARRVARRLQRKLRDEGAKSAKVRAHLEGSKWHLRVDLELTDAGPLLD